MFPLNNFSFKGKWFITRITLFLYILHTYYYRNHNIYYSYQLPLSAGDKPGVQVRQEGRCKLHQQAENATLRALLRVALPRRGGIKRSEEGFQGERRERRCVEASVLQAISGHSSASRLGYRCHIQRAPSPFHMVRSHQAPTALSRREEQRRRCFKLCLCRQWPTSFLNISYIM